MGWGMWGGPQTQYDPAMQMDQAAQTQRMQAGLNPMMGAMGPVQPLQYPMFDPARAQAPAQQFNPQAMDQQQLEALRNRQSQAFGNIPVGNQPDQSPMAQQNAQMQQIMANRQRMMQKQAQGPGSRIIRTDQKQAPQMQGPSPMANPMAQDQVAQNRQRMMQKRMQGPGSRMVY